MTGKHLPFLMLAMAVFMAPSGAQLPFLSSQDLEDLLYRDESAHIPEPESGTFGDPGHPPIHLNTASVEELESSGILTPYQLHQLVKYREKFGALYSIHELTALPGFHAASVEQIKSRVILSTEPVPLKKAPRHMALLTIERSYPSTKVSKNYSGSLLKTSLRIMSNPSARFTWALSYDKDAGEAFTYQNRPQYLSGFLACEGKGFLKQLVAGKYQMNQGLGLVNGSGFFHRVGYMRITRQSISRIKPFASLTENRYERGLACKMGTQRIQCLLWASSHKFSISPSAITAHPEPDQWLEHQYASGLFRTSGELEKRDLANRIHAGIQVVYLNQGLSLGVLSGSEWVLPGKKTAIILEHIPGIAVHQHLSLHGNWYRNRIQVFGELAASDFNSLAFLVGARYQFNDFIFGTLLFHHYGPGYRGSLPSSYGSGSRIQNDQGLAFNLHMESGTTLIIKLTGELFRYPAPRYLTQVPSEGCRLALTLQNPDNRTIHWKTRLTSNYWQTTPADKHAAVRPLQNSRVHRLEGKVIYKFQDRFRWMNRLIVGYFSQGIKGSTGYAAVQQVSYDRGPLKITAQCVLFEVEDWANRIYLHEPGFYYSFSFPVYYGSGQKSTLLLSIKLLDGLRISVRISSTRNRGNQGLDGGVQLRLRF
jgi:hypothetical protein